MATERRSSEVVSAAASIAIHALVLLFLVGLRIPTTLTLEEPSVDVTLSEPAGSDGSGGGGGGGSSAPPVTSIEVEPVVEPAAVTAVRRPPPPSPTGADEATPTESEVSAVQPSGDGTVASDGTGDGPGTTGGTGGGTGGGDGTGVGTGTGAGSGERCGGPFDGVWVGRAYFPTPGTWSEITLTMTRTGDRVSGSIVNHEWEGPRTRTRPIPCIDGGYEWRVRMPASGSIHDHTFAFESDQFEVMPDSCWRGGRTYNPDRFVGRLDEAAERLEMTWFDDGTLRAGQAIQFRRVGCVGEPR